LKQKILSIYQNAISYWHRFCTPYPYRFFLTK